MAESRARKARIASVVAATCISLACGTNVCLYDFELAISTQEPEADRAIVCIFSMGALLHTESPPYDDRHQCHCMPRASAGHD